jgi:hypothetical protein
MEKEILTAIQTLVPAFITGIVGVLLKTASPLISEVEAYFANKKQVLAIKVGVDTYNANLSKAGDIYKLVDEEFRITPTLEKTISEKQNLFNVELKKALPSLTDVEIGQFRQIIAAGINAGKAIIVAPVEVPTEATETTKAEPVINTVLITPVTTTVYKMPDGTEVKLASDTTDSTIATSTVTAGVITANGITADMVATDKTPTATIK